MKYVVIGGHNNFTQCLGIYNNGTEACGRAVYYLDDVINDCYPDIKERLSISIMYELELNTGYGMHIIGDEHVGEYVHVLYCKEGADGD